MDRHSSSRIGSSIRVSRGIFHNEGGLFGFYRGLTPNLVGNSVSWGLYFLWYGNIKDVLDTVRGSRQGGLTSLDFFIASGSAGKLD